MSNVSSNAQSGNKRIPPAGSPDAPKVATPGPTAQRRPWGLFSTALIIVLSFVLVPMVAQLLVSTVPSLLDWTSSHAQQWVSHSTFANFLYVLCAESLTLGLLAWFLHRHKVRFTAAVGLHRRPRWLDLGIGLMGAAAYVALFIATVAVVSAVVPLDTSKEQALGFEKGIGGLDLVLAYVSLAVLPPIVEEVVFRGFLYGTLRARNIRFLFSALTTSVIFGGLHLFGAGDGSLLWIAFVDTFVLSMVLCLVREKSGGIWATMLIHALKNSFVFVNLFILNVR